VLSESELLRAMLDVGYFPPNTRRRLSDEKSLQARGPARQNTAYQRAVTVDQRAIEVRYAAPLVFNPYSGVSPIPRHPNAPELP
jgi:hypothetical protein